MSIEMPANDTRASRIGKGLQLFVSGLAIALLASLVGVVSENGVNGIVRNGILSIAGWVAFSALVVCFWGFGMVVVEFCRQFFGKRR